jgi:phage terminase small subunit
MQKKPIELHKIESTKPSANVLTLEQPEPPRRIPVAEWLDNPDAWDKQQFVRETSEYLFETYGLSHAQNKHTVSMLAEQMDIYIKCTTFIGQEGFVVEFNNGETRGTNPYIAIRNKASELIVRLMGELGLTPKSSLTGKKTTASKLTGLLKGPKSA